MINEKELRIGNLVTDRLLENDILEVMSIGDGRINLTGAWPDGCLDWQYSVSDLSGIPLTQEWLLKLGFEKEIKDFGSPFWDKYEEWSKDGYRFIQDSKGLWFLTGYNWNTYHFGNVHQLQNLYFALTGEEL